MDAPVIVSEEELRSISFFTLVYMYCKHIFEIKNHIDNNIFIFCRLISNTKNGIILNRKMMVMQSCKNWSKRTVQFLFTNV